MTTSEFVECLMQVKREVSPAKTVDEAAANETAQLVSGSIVYPLYGTLWQYGYDMDIINERKGRTCASLVRCHN